MNHLFIYIVITFFHILISAATGAAASGYSDTGNAADQIGLLGFRNDVCVVRGNYDLAKFPFKCRQALFPSLN